MHKARHPPTTHSHLHRMRVKADRDALDDDILVGEPVSLDEIAHQVGQCTVFNLQGQNVPHIECRLWQEGCQAQGAR